MGTKTLKFISNKKLGKVEKDWGDLNGSEADDSFLCTDESMLESDERA